MADIFAAAKAGASAELRLRLLEQGDAADGLSYRGEGTPDAIVGNTALHWASAKGHDACVTLLLAAGADLHARNNGDSTPLHSAAISGHAGCARLLVDAHADPNLEDEYGDSPLKLAERAGRTDVVDAMLGGGRAPAAPAGAARSTEGRPAAEMGRRRSVDDHREMGNECFKATEYDAAYAHYSAALALAEADGDGDAARERRAALYSNRSGALAALERWGDAEADARAAVDLRPSWFKAHSRLGAALEGAGRLDDAVAAYARAAQLDGAVDVTREALQRARAALRAQRLEALLERTSAQAATPPSAPAPAPAVARSAEQLAYRARVAAWQDAAKRGDVDALAASLAAHPELLHNRSEDTAEKLLGNTALHWASARGHVAAARWLLARGADPNGQNLGGSSPLHSAASHARPELIELLLEHGADPAVADQHGETAHDAAHRRGFAAIAGALDRGAALPAVRWSTRAKPESSASARALGNAAFGSGALRLALGHYTDALVLLREETATPADGGELAAALHSNRSAAHASLGQAALALEDAEQVLALRPDWAKGWSRKGAALHLARDWAEAAAAYARGLELEPQNSAMRKGLDDAEAALRSHVV